MTGDREAAILHVDMDAFYAAVEVLEDPSLAGKPVIVGGRRRRGVVASCSYEARAYGVHSAMPSMRARRLCPHAVFVPGRYELYASYSRRLHELLTSITPLVEGIGLDEAFLDVHSVRRLWGTGPEIATRIRAQVHEELGLWVSVGVATSKLVAKLASEAAKPTPSPAGPVPGPERPGQSGGPGPERPGQSGGPGPERPGQSGGPGPERPGQSGGPGPERPGQSGGPGPERPGQSGGHGPGVFVVEPGRELAFLHPLGVRRLWGVGPATQRRLERFGVATVGDLAAVPLDSLVRALGSSLGHHLHELAWARDSRPVEPEREPKSIGHEETYPVDHHDREPLHKEVVRLSDAVATRLRRNGLAGRTVTLKVRFGDFRTITRSRTEGHPLDTPAGVAAVALDLLSAVEVSPGVRLLGVSASGLVKVAASQMELAVDPDGDGPGRAVAQAVDEVRQRFGDKSVGPASLVGKQGLKVKRKGDQQWGPSR